MTPIRDPEFWKKVLTNGQRASLPNPTAFQDPEFWKKILEYNKLAWD